MLLHNHPSGFLEPSGPDLHVAARLHDDGVGFGIVNNDVSTLYVVVEMPRARAVARLDSLEVANLLTESGPVARVLGTAAFEDRPGQRDMAAYIADAYNDGGIALLEAGTGVGKSFAYLVPAIEWARLNGERTVVSTNTINLQEQLVGKDLPILSRAFTTGDRAVTFALLKGWRNYLCLSRLEQARAGQESLFDDARGAELEAIAGWASRTADGSLSDLVEEPSNDVWDAVAAESDLCTRLKCPHFDRCFVFAARRKAAEADVVVVNHHLLASDLAVRIASDNWQEAAVLPPYRRLILDEAHHLEDVAAQHLGTQVSMIGVQRLLGRLERNGRGLLPTLAAELASHTDLMGAASRDLLGRTVLDALGAARRWAEELFGRLARRLDHEQGATPVLRLTDAFAEDGIWREGLDVALDNLLVAFSKLRDGVETIADRLSVDDPAEMRTRLIGELRGVTRRLDAAADGLTATLQPKQSNRGTAPAVRWMERRGRRTPNLTLSAVPLDLAPVLKESLFDRTETVVLTSATLAAGGEFTFLEERLGLSLQPSRVTVREILPSPFDFGAQCVFGIPTDIPEPLDDSRKQHRADDRLGGGFGLGGRGVHDPRDSVDGLRPRHLPRHDPRDCRRADGHPDDDPAAPRAHRQGARQPPLPRGHGVRRSPHRRRARRHPRQDGVPGVRDRLRLQVPDVGAQDLAGISGKRTPELSERGGAGRGESRAARRGLHHRAADRRLSVRGRLPGVRRPHARDQAVRQRHDGADVRHHQADPRHERRRDSRGVRVLYRRRRGRDRRHHRARALVADHRRRLPRRLRGDARQPGRPGDRQAPDR